MNDVPPGRPVAITFEQADQHGALPVALGAEPVPVGHQPLDGDARAAGCSPSRSSNVSVNAPNPPAVRNVRSPTSIRAASRSVVAPGAVRAELGRHVVLVVVGLDEPVDVARRATAADRVGQLARRRSR